jgi:hypothetical protein
MTNKDLISQYVDTGVGISEYQVGKLSNKDKKTYIRKRLIAVQHGVRLENYEFKMLTPEERKEYLKIITNEVEMGIVDMADDYGVSNEIFILLTPDERNNYLNAIEINGYVVPHNQFDLMTPEVKREYLDYFKKKWGDRFEYMGR